AFVESKNNVHIAWPTKLALAPDLADRIIIRLQEQDLQKNTHNMIINLPQAIISLPLWDKVFL
ncbi:MAG: FAD-dependent oxidoreductase, partial [Gammaproteobacteria bacterium]